MMNPKYPDVEVQLSGEDGSSLFIVTRVARAMRKAGAPDDDVSAFYDEALSGDYDNVLRTAMKWVSVL